MKGGKMTACCSLLNCLAATESLLRYWCRGLTAPLYPFNSSGFGQEMHQQLQEVQRQKDLMQNLPRITVGLTNSCLTLPDLKGLELLLHKD